MATYPDLDGALDLVKLQIRQDMDIDPDDSENAEWLNRGLSCLRRVVKTFWEFASGHDLDFVHVREQVSLPASAPGGFTEGRVA